jgi:hypothetical protein
MADEFKQIWKTGRMTAFQQRSEAPVKKLVPKQLCASKIPF